jgi:hypothetical protein
MAEITSGSLIRDWHDRFVKPKQGYGSLGVPTTFPTEPEPIPALSRPGPFSTGTPSPTPAIDFSTPAESPAVNETPPIDTQDPEAPADTGISWLDKAAQGLGGMGRPAQMGLLGAGLSMMATPPRAVPYSGAEIIGRSGLAGLGMYEKALEDKRKQQALDVSAEEHRLSREDQSLYRKGMLADKEVQRKIQEENAKSLAGAREASAEAKKGKLVPVKQSDGSVVYERMLDAVGQEVPQKPKSSAWREVNFNGKNQWVDLNSPEAADLAKQGAFGVKDKPGFAYFVGDDGRVTEVQKGAPPGTAPKEVAPPGTGKKTKPPTAAGGAGSAAAQQFKAWEAAFEKDNGRKPTAAEYAAYKPGAKTVRNPRGEMATTYKVGENKKYISDAKTREAVKDRIRQMAAAGYTRKQIEDAVKGTQWE